MKLSILTLFPQIIESFISESIIKRAQQKKLVEFKLFDLRNFAHDKYKTVDDHPFGGGAGMLLKIEPLVEAIEHIEKAEGAAHKILLTPKGKTLTQQKAIKIVQLFNCSIVEKKQFNNLAIPNNLAINHILLICGHYEGFDARIENFIDEELSIGNYVMSSGEAAAIVVIDTVVRLIPGVLKKEEATRSESFQSVNGEELLEYPQYTLPRDFRGLSVPEVLLSGDHKKIVEWKLQKAREETKKKNPFLPPLLGED